MEHSRIPLRKWAIAIYLNATGLKDVSSMKLHRDLKITQKSAWFMAHRPREAFRSEDGLFDGPVEADETHIGGKRRNMSLSKRRGLKDAGRRPVGKEAVVDVKDRKTNKVRAKAVPVTDAPHVAVFVAEQMKDGAKVYTNDAVNHSISEYVRDMAHTNGMESFWATLKRGYQGTFHHMSLQHLDRYVNEFAGHQNIRNSDTITQMRDMVVEMIGKRLMYSDFVGEKS